MLQEHISPIWINNNDTLAEHCQHWLTLKRIALDTEFIRTDTYYPLPGLIQLNTGENIYFIDPLTISQWQPFLEILQHPNVIKILHACSEDLEVFQLLTGGIPQPLFDTQLAAAYANTGYSMGYQKLVHRLLEHELPKGETRSNWRQRPLTEAQIQYAALDVAHLLKVHSLLEQQMREKDTNPSLWLADDCRHMQPAILSNDPDTLWRQVKRAWQLRPQQLAVLRALCSYQEKQAQCRDVPRSRVIPKGSLWALARYQPDNLKALARIPDMRSSIITKDGKTLLHIIKTAAKLPESEWPARKPGPLPKHTQPYGKVIRQFITRRAEELELPVEILLPSKISTSILRDWANNNHFSLPDNLQGWRRDMVGKPLIDWLNEQVNDESTGISLQNG